MSARDKAAEVLAAHLPTYTEHANDPTTTFYCHSCSEAVGEWVTWTPEHVADALAEAGLLAQEDGFWQFAADAIRRAEKAERERNEAREALARVEALADEYDRQARHESYGGELWSTTASAISAALRGDA